MNRLKLGSKFKYTQTDNPRVFIVGHLWNNASKIVFTDLFDGIVYPTTQRLFSVNDLEEYLNKNYPDGWEVLEF